MGKLPTTGDLMPPEIPSEGSVKFTDRPSPYFPTEIKSDVPAESKWIPDMLDVYFRKLSKTVLKCALPYYQYPPFEHIDIDVKTTITAVSSATPVTVTTITVPQHQIAVIRLYGQDIDAVVPPNPATMWDDIKWTFKKGNFALQYYDAFVGQRGSLLNPRETAITIEGPDTFTVSVLNTASCSYYVTVSLIGHQYSFLGAAMGKEDTLSR